MNGVLPGKHTKREPPPEIINGANDDGKVGATKVTNIILHITLCGELVVVLLCVYVCVCVRAVCVCARVCVLLLFDRLNVLHVVSVCVFVTCARAGASV